MKKTIYLIIALSIISCGKKHKDDDDQIESKSEVIKSGGGWVQSQTAHLYDSLDEAFCADSTFGQIVYIKGESKFYFCDENQIWQEVDLKGMAGENGKDGKNGLDGKDGKSYDEVKSEYIDHETGLTWGVGAKLTPYIALNQRGCLPPWRRASASELQTAAKAFESFKQYDLGGFFTGNIAREPIGIISKEVNFSETINGVTTSKAIVVQENMGALTDKPEIITADLNTKLLFFWPKPTNLYGDDGHKDWLKPYYSICVKGD